MRMSANDVWTVAQTVYGEARGESDDGKRAIAQVILNRATGHPRWRDLSLSSICKSPWQFACWNKHDPHRHLLDVVTVQDAVFVTCLRCTLDVLSQQAGSLVGEATHYYVIGTPEPSWARGKVPVTIIGAHQFYAHIA